MTSAPNEGDDRTQAGKVLLVGLAAGAVGYAARRHAKGLSQKIEELKSAAITEKEAAAKQRLIDQQQSLDFREGVELSVGMAGFGFGPALVLAAALLASGVRMRRAMIALAPALLFVSIYAVYLVGVESLIFTSVIAFAYLAYLTAEPDARRRAEVDEFRKLPTRLAVPEEEIVGSYREVALRARTQPQKALRAVPELPPALARMLPQVGEGRPYRFFQLREGLAYAAFVEADATGVSDYVTVLMALEEKAPRFVAQPLPIVEGKPIPNTGVRFKSDPEFTAAYLVDAQGSDPKAVRAFLSEPVRDELLNLPAAWLHVDGTAMAATLFGPFDTEAADALVELADVVFAEHGGGGGPTLLEPDGIVGAGTKKKAKKKRADAAASAPA